MNYADLHLHISLKQYINGRKSIWESKPYKPGTKPGLAIKYDQSDIRSIIKSNVKLAVIALHPPEKILTAALFNEFIGKMFFGFKIGRVSKLYKIHKSYFAYLEHELQYILDGLNDDLNRKRKYSAILVRKEPDLKDESITKLVISIEGSHALASEVDPISQSLLYWSEILYNLDKIKNWDYPVFSLTLCHFAYNYLSGQSWGLPLPGSISGMDIPGIGMLYAKDQTINEYGFKLIEKALDNVHGRRIIIDLKHTHIVARYQYYKWLQNQKYKEKVPIIVSHAGLSGRKTYVEAIDVFSRPHEDKKDNYEEFYPWEINLCDDEIQKIYESEGMIGISLDQRILGADNQQFKHKILEHLANVGLPITQTSWHRVLFVANITRVVQIVGNKNGWNILCIGSDFDGGIDPIDCLPAVGCLEGFEQDLINCFDKLYLGKDYKKELFLDENLTLEKALRKVFYENLRDFIKKNYPKDKR